MVPSILKIFKSVSYALLSCIIIIQILACNNQDRDVAGLYKKIESIDYSNVEAAVVEKISRLLDETKKDPGIAERWGKLGMNLYIHGFKQAAVPVFKKAAALDEQDFRWTYFCAMALNDLNSEEAITWFEKSRALKPNYPPLSVMLGDLYLISGDYQKAEECFNEALVSYKNVPHAQVGLAKIAMNKNALDTAYMHLNKALKIAPSYRETHVLLADLYRRKGQKANLEYELGIIEQLPDKLDLKDPFYNQMVDEGVSTFWHTVRGDNYAQAGHLEKAADEFKKALQIKKHASFYNNLGNVYQKQKKYEQAIEQYKLALKMDSVNIDALNNMGVVYFKNGDVDKAISCVKQSVILDPQSKDGYLNLGTFYKQLKRNAESVHYFKQGMELDPEDLRFAYQLSWLFSSAPQREIRNGKEALRLAKLIFNNKDIDIPSKYDLVAAALAENGQFDKASDMALSGYQAALKARKQKQAAEILKRQKLYDANKAYRELD